MIDGITKTSRPLYFFHFRTLLNFGFQSFYLGKFDHDLTATSLGIMVNKGNHPQMAELFRLVKSCNLPSYMGMSQLTWLSHGKIPQIFHPRRGIMAATGLIVALVLDW